MNWDFLKTLKFSDLPLDEEDKTVLAQLAERLQDNYPYNAQEYAGQMIKPPHSLAQAAHWMTSLVNPNNHALDGGLATSALEIEVIDQLGAMVGFESCLGHLTSGGTMANLEALWVGRQSSPQATVIASSASHYTHSRMSEVLGMPFKEVPTDPQGRMEIMALEKLLLTDNVPPVVVVTLGTTGLAKVDPLADVVALREKYTFRIHVDAAYGGYFKLTQLPEATRRHFEAMAQADSVVIDPHKHGLQPYGCGSILLKNPAEGRFYKHDSPYTYFTSGDLHLGEITLECSRPGASAAALWATMKKFPLVPGGRFAHRLQDSLLAAKGLHQCALERGFWSLDPELDICIFSSKGTSSATVSDQNRDFFERKAQKGIHLALLKIKKEQWPWDLRWDSQELIVVRSVLMKPEHNDPVFWTRLLE
ncbi:MAG TPA: aspartate aminotransferase family protein [Cryomorphaceae bacterium]|nr:aspartate aminotransferase family protein [Cryomorphaceae bacterium]|tara:strand:- start:823 stop:2082 length:1260 start_codon:yes stop_codon:yes gene_type:complete